MRFFLIAFLAIPSLALAADSAADCSGNPKPFTPGGGDWNGWGVESTNSRYQPQPGLAAADVPRLKLKWAFGFAGESRNQAQPVIVGGRVFVGTTGGTVYSLDASTGCVYWTYNAGGAIKNAIGIVQADTPRWVAYFGDAAGYAHAVNAETGAPIWKMRVDDHPAARVTGSPTYYQGRLYVPVASGEETLQAQPQYECCTFQGSLVALDAKTGRVLWKTRTIPDPPKPYKKNAEGTQLYGPAGAGIWSAPTIDEKRKRIYVGTGNSYTGVDLPTSDAILAFDLESGSLLWSSQVTPGDNWIPGCPRSVNCPENPGDDLDFGNSPVLRTLPDGKQVLVASQKSGVIYGLDPEARGKILWKTRLGVGNGLLGGIGWGTAFDGPSAYAAIADYNKPEGAPGLYAVRIDTGEKMWSAPAPQDAGNGAQAAAVSAMPGIVFSASFGGHLRAYSSKTGAIVWDFNAARDFEAVNHVPAKGGSFDGGGVAVAHGLVVTVSGYGFAGGVPGNVLLAFSVDGK